VKCLKIKTKKGQIHPFKLNKAQIYLHEQIEEQRRRTGKVRKVILKGRQQGISTYAQGRFYWKVTFNGGVSAFILTHEAEATKNLFGMTQRYYELCPASLKPSLDEDSAKSMVFDKLDSGYRVGTAGNKAVGRSMTITHLHGSEVAFWPNAADHLAGILQAVPQEDGTEVLLESTANGEGGVFYDYCMDAKNGIGEFELVFIPWFWQDDYRSPVPIGFKPSAEELKLEAVYDLDRQQLAWRRKKIAELKSVDLFKQEYPNNVEEAFLFSGRPVFDPNNTTAAIEECFEPIRRAEVMTSTGVVMDRKDGRLRIWKEPKIGDRYVMGADVAEGLAHGDFSCCDVLDTNGNQVAQWHGHIDPENFGKMLCQLGNFYNNAFIGVERNNHGLTTLTAMKNLKYPKLYVQEDNERRNDGTQTKKLGWLTTSKSKFLIIDQLATEFIDEDTGIVCRETIDECRTYAIEDNGSYNAKPKCFDDRVMSMAIAKEMLRKRPKGGSGMPASNIQKPNVVGRGGY